jgi:hypothetical protein
MPAWVQQRVRRAATAAWVASALVALVALIHVVRFVFLELQVLLLERVAAHEAVVPGEAFANDARINFVEGAGQLAWFAAGLAFLIWVQAAHASLSGLREDHAGSTPGWAVGCYFIPFLNLVRPYQDMAMLARLSDPRDLELPVVREIKASPGYREAAIREVAPTPWSPPPAVVGLWWAAYIVLSLSAYGIVAMGTENGVLAVIERSHAHMARDVLLILTGALCIAVIRGVTACQRERVRRLEILSGSDSAS